MSPYLHDSATLSQRQGDALFVPKCNPPNCLSLSEQLADKVASLQIPNLNTTVTSATDDASVVKLQACDAIVVGSQPVYGTHLLQGPDTHRPIGSTRNERVTTHLQLPNERCVALEDSKALPVNSISSRSGRNSFGIRR